MKQDVPSIDFSFALASSVHDMKNSLGMLLSTLSGVMQAYPPQNEKHAESYAVLEYEATRINSELIQLLSLYRIENEQIKLNIDEHVVIDVLADQAARNEVLARSRNIAVTIDCDEELTGYFDMDLIAGVINNMLINALRHAKSNIVLSAHQQLSGVCIRVEDDGDGFPEYMLDSSKITDTKIGFASGRPHLGVLFAHKVALMHTSNSSQGAIELMNKGRLDGGCFSLYLP